MDKIDICMFVGIALFVLIFLFIVVSGFIHLLTYPAATYEVPAIVEEVNPVTGYAILTDWDGEAWIYEDGNLEAGQMVVIEFDDMGTTEIYDDEIVKIIVE